MVYGLRELFGGVWHYEQRFKGDKVGLTQTVLLNIGKEEKGKCKSSKLFITNGLDMRVTGELIKVHMEKGR